MLRLVISAARRAREARAGEGRVWHPPALLRPYAATALLLTGALLGACQSPSPSPSPTPKATSAEERGGERGDESRGDEARGAASPGASAPAETPPSVDLRLRLSVGDSWVETVETELYSYRSNEEPPESPSLRTIRHERFEVLEADDGGHRLRITLSALRLEPAGRAALDSRDGGTVPGDPLSQEQMALLGIPLVYRLSDRGETLEVEEAEAFRSAAARRRATLRDEVGLDPPTPEEEAQWRIFLDTELKKPLEWGIRPIFQGAPVALGGAWTHEVRTSTLFNATARWPLTKRIESIDGERVTIRRDADAEFEETPAMLRYIKSAHASLEGIVVVDRRTGALIRTETTVTGMVEAAAQPDAGFPGGTLKMRNVTTRERLGENATGS